MAVVTFNYTNWVTEFPEFAAVSSARAQAMFNRACFFMDNTGGGPVSDVPTLTELLYLATAHFVQLTGGATPASGQQVGRVSNASEGSVSAALDYGNQAIGQTAAFWLQTQYGAMFWAMTAPYRSFVYYPPQLTAGATGLWPNNPPA